jgi:hypothetical protein
MRDIDRTCEWTVRAFGRDIPFTTSIYSNGGRVMQQVCEALEAYAWLPLRPLDKWGNREQRWKRVYGIDDWIKLERPSLSFDEIWKLEPQIPLAIDYGIFQRYIILDEARRYLPAPKSCLICDEREGEWCHSLGGNSAPYWKGVCDTGCLELLEQCERDAEDRERLTRQQAALRAERKRRKEAKDFEQWLRGKQILKDVRRLLSDPNPNSLS